MIASSLCDNRDLKVLDLSWNQLGVRPPKRKRLGKPAQGKKPEVNMKKGDIGRAWGAMFIENKGIVHLDLSFNRFAKDDTSIMAADVR